jgi:hypothetical protein
VFHPNRAFAMPLDAKVWPPAQRSIVLSPGPRRKKSRTARSRPGATHYDVPFVPSITKSARLDGHDRSFLLVYAEPRRSPSSYPSPVSSHSSDFPHSRQILNKISAPISFSPRSIDERYPWLMPMRWAKSCWFVSNPRSSRMRRPTVFHSIKSWPPREFFLDFIISTDIKYLYRER